MPDKAVPHVFSDMSLCLHLHDEWNPGILISERGGSFRGPQSGCFTTNPGLQPASGLEAAMPARED